VNKKEKSKEKDTEPGNNDNGELKALLGAIHQNQQELSDRLSDIEETSHKSVDNSALVKLANMYFNTDDKHIVELSFISPLAARPFAEAMALDSMTTEEVRNGTISLNRMLILTYLRFQRSVRGRHLGIGAEAMLGQVTSEGKGDEEMPDFEAGGE
jgi:hypothetical protein